MKNIFIILMLLVSILHAEAKFGVNQYTAVKTVLSTDGYINKKVYEQFWTEIRGKVSDKELREVKQSIPEMQRKQILIWNAIKVTIKEKKVHTPPEVIKILTEMKNNKQTPIYRRTIKLFKAASIGKPMKLNGRIMYINLEMADQVLSGLDASMERFNMLLLKKWNPKKKERILNKNMKVLSAYPFVKTTLHFDGGLVQEQFNSQLDLDTSNLLTINKNVNSTFSNKESTKICVDNIAQALGDNNPFFDYPKVNGYQSARATVQAKNEHNKLIHINIQCLVAHENMISNISASPNASVSAKNNNDIMRDMNLK